MAGRSVTFELPEELYAHLERRAAESQRSVGDEIVHLLTELVPAGDDGLPAGLEDELARTKTSRQVRCGMV